MRAEKEEGGLCIAHLDSKKSNAMHTFKVF